MKAESPHVARTAILTLLGAAAYAVIRYHGFKGAPWGDAPTWTMNKVLASAALVLLALAVVTRGRGRSAQAALTVAMALTATHVLLSLILLGPAYYPAFFADGKLTAMAGLAMALGVAAAATMPVRAAGRRELRDLGRAWRLALVAALVAGHTLPMGLDGWATPGHWPGGLPPITLLATVLATVTLGAAVRDRR